MGEYIALSVLYNGYETMDKKRFSSINICISLEMGVTNSEAKIVILSYVVSWRDLGPSQNFFPSSDTV